MVKAKLYTAVFILKRLIDRAERFHVHAVEKLFCLKAKSFANGYFILWVNLVELAAIGDNGNACIFHCLICSHLCFSYFTPMLIVRVGGIFEHWKLDDYERKLVVAPLLSPKLYEGGEKGIIAVRLMVV